VIKVIIYRSKDAFQGEEPMFTKNKSYMLRA